MISVDFSALAYSLHTEDGWPPVTWENSRISTSLGQYHLRTASESAAGKTLSDSHRLSESLHYLQDNTTSTSPQWSNIRKSIRSWLLYFFRSTTIWHFETWVWGWARPGPVPYPLELQNKNYGDSSESGRLLTRHMTVNGILYSRTSQTMVRCAAPHPWMEYILTAGYCRLVNFLIIPLSSLSRRQIVQCLVL